MVGGECAEVGKILCGGPSFHVSRFGLCVGDGGEAMQGFRGSTDGDCLAVGVKLGQVEWLLGR